MASLSSSNGNFPSNARTIDGGGVRPFLMPGQAFFFLPVRAIAPAAGAITSQSPIVTTTDVM
jgi:hypothetical protein